MDSPSVPWLQRFDKSSHLLLCALKSGPQGALAAFRYLQHSQSMEEPKRGFNWQILLENLCAQEPVLEGPEKTLALKPLLLLLPVLCQRNLFSLLLMIQSSVPKDCLEHLLQATRQQQDLDSWVQRLSDLLQVELQEKSSSAPVLLTDACHQQLKELCQKTRTPSCRQNGKERRISWYVKRAEPCLVPTGSASYTESQIQKNKPVIEETLSPEKKRSRLDASDLDTELSEACTIQQEASIGNSLVKEGSGNETVHRLDNNYKHSQKEEEVENGSASQNSQQDTAAEIPDYIKVHVPKLKERLEMQFDPFDGIAPPELQVLNECNPNQLEGLCSLLQLSERPENELLRFCTWLVMLSPDLGYNNAAVLAGKLFLSRVLLLTEPASWPLTTALMMFCSKYARPVCCTLVPSILRAPGKGLEQIKLVCKLIEESLEPEYVKLVFSQITEMPWIEDLLTVVHSLLGRQVELSPDLFNKLVLNLCQMAQEFSSSMHYSKLVLTVLTKYQSSITLAHQHHLSCALDLNKTILKKSIQVALKRVIPK